MSKFNIIDDYYSGSRLGFRIENIYFFLITSRKRAVLTDTRANRIINIEYT